MLYFKLKNYEEFKEVFGTRVANNGKKVRSNHILLSFLKNEFKRKRFCNLGCMNINAMYYYILETIRKHEHYQILQNGELVYSSDYALDEFQGVCEDGDSRCIRYVRRDNGRVYKMKAGKFMRNVLESCGITNEQCEQVIIYVCERFAEDWSSYIESNYGDGLELHVDDNFCKIYDEEECLGDFKSCMSGESQYSFYEDAVKAKAAYLTNDDGYIVARCVIFTEVHNEDTDEILRLAERQYSSEGDNILKQILVNKLISANEIDGYKQIGADCHKSRNFLRNNGESLSEDRLSIKCNLEPGDTLSYQDSFKWYDYDSKIADNYFFGDSDLSTTDSTFEYGEYDSYHERYCECVENVYVYRSWLGRFAEETCDSEDLDDFYYCERYQGYYDDAERSEYADDWIPRGEYVHSDFLDDYLWKDEAEWCDEAEDYFPSDKYDFYFDEWKKDHWEWDEYNAEYVEEVVEAYIWNDTEYDKMDVARDYVESNFEEYDGEWYSVLNDEGIPFHLVEELEEV